MIDDKYEAIYTRSGEVRYQKRVPFTVREVTTRQEILDWQARAETKSLRRILEKRDVAIYMCTFGPTPNASYSHASITQRKDSFFAKSWNWLINSFLNIKFNQKD